MATPLFAASTHFLNSPVAKTEPRVEAAARKPLKSSLAWEGSQFVDKDFIFHLTVADIAEVDGALASFQGPLTSFTFPSWF